MHPVRSFIFIIVGALSFATLASIIPACAPAADCATVVKYKDVRAFTNCTTCHSSTLSDAQRQGAPSGENYDTYAAASGSDEAQQQLSGGSMPPNKADLNDEQRQEAITWYQCGTPQ